jgi:hypothetical protein
VANPVLSDKSEEFAIVISSVGADWDLAEENSNCSEIMVHKYL